MRLGREAYGQSPIDRLQSPLVRPPRASERPVILRTRLLRRTLVAATFALTLVALLPTSAAGSRQATEVLWKAPTPAEGKVYKVAAGSSVSFTLSAALPAALPATVPVEISASSALPAGAKLTVRPGSSATARFTWSPT